LKLWNDPEMRPLIINNTGNGFNNAMATIRAGSPLPPPQHFQSSPHHFGGSAPSPFGSNPFDINGGGGHQFQQHLGSGQNNFGLSPYVASFTPSQQFFPGSGGFNYQQNTCQPYTNSMIFPPPLVQQKSAATQNLLNSPVFMPTSVFFLNFFIRKKFFLIKR
jgi:hypothetical protein